MEYFVGPDVSLRSCGLCILDGKGAAMFERELPCEVGDIAGSLPIRHMRAAVPSEHQPDCGEKRDPDERQ